MAKYRVIDWMNRREKRKLAKYIAGFNLSDAYVARIGMPMRFVKAHRNWQRKVLTRPAMIYGRSVHYVIHDEVQHVPEEQKGEL